VRTELAIDFFDSEVFDVDSESAPVCVSLADVSDETMQSGLAVCSWHHFKQLLPRFSLNNLPALLNKSSLLCGDFVTSSRNFSLYS
jgi:hypothetical protein